MSDYIESDPGSTLVNGVWYWKADEVQARFRRDTARIAELEAQLAQAREALVGVRRKVDAIYHHSDGITKCDCDSSVNSLCDEHATRAICFDALRELDATVRSLQERSKP